MCHVVNLKIEEKVKVFRNEILRRIFRPKIDAKREELVLCLSIRRQGLCDIAQDYEMYKYFQNYNLKVDNF